MAELSDYGINSETLRQMYDAWCAGAKKSQLERDYLSAPQAHGKLFSTLVREHLGIETERQSGQSQRIGELEGEVARLRRLLIQHGIDPTTGH